jgi:acetyltransferase
VDSNFSPGAMQAANQTANLALTQVSKLASTPAEKQAANALTLRPIGLSDLDLEVNFLSSLSSATIYQRMLGTVRFKSIDSVRKLLDYQAGPEMALGAILNDGEIDLDGRSLAELIGVARYALTDEPGNAEMAIVLADRYQGQGIAKKLLLRLHELAKSAGYQQLVALTFASNSAMLGLAHHLGYESSAEPGDGTLRRITKSLVDAQPIMPTAAPMPWISALNRIAGTAG